MSMDGLLQPYCAELAGLKGQATFEALKSKFSFARCIRQGSAEAPRLWLQMAMQVLWNVEPEWVRKKMGVIMDIDEGRAHQICSFMWQKNTASCLTRRRTWNM